MHPFEELVRERKLLCPETRTPVELRDGRVVSERGRDFGPLRGPLDFLRGASETLDPASIASTDVERTRIHLELPDTPQMTAEIRKALAAAGLRFEKDHLSAEARMLAERFRIPEYEFASQSPRAPGPPVGILARLGAALRRPDEPFAIETIWDSVGERMTAGFEVYRSVRVRNAGPAAIRADGKRPGARIEAWWTAQDGSVVPACSLSTDLPIDIAPGREITLQVKVRPPRAPGRYTVHAAIVTPSGERVPFRARPVDVILCELPVFDYEFFPQPLDYESDHRVAVEGLTAYLRALRPGWSARLLEIGGGVHPTGQALAWDGHRVVSSDISQAQCRLGHLYFRNKHPNLDDLLGFISCDGSELPFADASFDGVMFFAAFHHFADPVRLLLEMKRVIRPDGFVFIGCDNCVPDPTDPLYKEELQRGINEQVWTLAEYTDFLRRTGFRVARARVDSHSMKLVLVNAP